MDSNKIDMYLVSKQKYFPPERLPYIREKLMYADDSKFQILMSVDLKDPTVIIIVSILLGTLGIDRFMIGDIGMGVLKLLTCGVCGILTIIDWVTIMGRTRQLNFDNIIAYL